MIYKVGVLGITGRVGQELAQLLAGPFTHGPDLFELSDAVARPGKVISVEGTSVRSLEEPPREPVHVWIDFSRPEATLRLLETIDTPLVVGTTGFTPAQYQAVHDYGKKHAVVMASNMSPGMSIMRNLVREVPSQQTFPSDVVLFEEHHRQKVDSPSGTAKSLLQILDDQDRSAQVLVSRAGQTVGTHTIRWVGQDEELEITHRAYHRSTFARGAILAAAFAILQPPGLYSMESVFGAVQ